MFPPDSFMWESRILRPCFSACKLAADGGNVGSARARHLHGGHRRVDRFGDLKAVTVDIFSALSESLRVAYHLFNVLEGGVFAAEQILHDLNFSELVNVESAEKARTLTCPTSPL